MALRIDKAFGLSLGTVMQMQNSFDIAPFQKRVAVIKFSRFTPEAAAAAAGKGRNS
jgi:plasmid maintenance system antidote protein VapI